MHGRLGGSHAARGRPGARSERAAYELEFVAHVLRRLKAPLGVLLEAAPDDALDVRRQVHARRTHRRRQVSQDRRAHVCRRRAAERPAADEQLVEHDPEREQIRSRVHRLAADLLRRHVRQRADHLALDRERCCDRRCLRRVRGRLRRSGRCEPEVEHLHAALACDHHVGWLEVAVHDSALVRSGQRVSEWHR